ncbi:hypothetical protein B0H14DRAFT_3719587 [Mycena olivaceomarginata]|nr:hypothetical protein B0H14DRAFT_3719587 [Mycena olivaceomarginata]
MSELPNVPQGDIAHLPFSLDATFGALELGVLFSVFLFGVLTVQVYLYFVQYPKDPRGFKWMVAMVWILDLGHTIAICHCIYTITVTKYGQPTIIILPPKSLDISIFLSGFIGPLEQVDFVFLPWPQSDFTVPLPIFCATLSLLRFGGSTGLFAISLAGPTIQSYLIREKWLIEAVVILGAAVDVILAVALCYQLSFWRKAGFRSIGAVTLLVTFLTMKNNLVYGGVFFLMAQFFSNSLLFSLHSRTRFARICAESLMIPGSTTQSISQIASSRPIPLFELSPLSPEPPDLPKRQPSHSALVPLPNTDLSGPVSPVSPLRPDVASGASVQS